MRKLLLLFIMLLSTCAFSQTMDENTFFGKHPNFGRTELAFYGTFTKMSLSDMEDKKIVARLVKKYVKDYIDDSYGVVKAEEKDFMINYLTNVASKCLEAAREKRKEAEAEAEAQEQAKRKQQEQQERDAQRLKQDSQIEISTDQYVDLGISVYWGGCNLGASSPEKYGGWYLWGETENRGPGVFISGNHIIDSRKYANVYSKNIELTYEDAAKSLGEGWSTPTQYQFEELVERCNIYRGKYKGVLGFKFVGPSGKAIFLPADGQIEYMLSSYRMYKSEVARTEIPDVDAGACIRANAEEMSIEFGGISRSFTGVIRPVKTK